jgi:hypothetical protein
MTATDFLSLEDLFHLGGLLRLSLRPDSLLGLSAVLESVWVPEWRVARGPLGMWPRERPE